MKKETVLRIVKYLFIIYCIVLVYIFLVMIIEITQFITFTGTADIYDIILNTIGAMIGYGIIKIKPLRKVLKLDE